MVEARSLMRVARVVLVMTIAVLAVAWAAFWARAWWAPGSVVWLAAGYSSGWAHVLAMLAGSVASSTAAVALMRDARLRRLAGYLVAVGGFVVAVGAGWWTFAIVS